MAVVNSDFETLSEEELRKFNDTNISILKYKISLCRLMHIRFVIRCYDIDDTVVYSKDNIEAALGEISKSATYKFFDKEIRKITDREDREEFEARFYDNRDRIFEGRNSDGRQINYAPFHEPEFLIPGAIEYINYAIANSNSSKVATLYKSFKLGKDVSNERVEFNLFVSHHNGCGYPETEEVTKLRKYYSYCPDMDAIIPVQIYKEPYNGTKREMTNKACEVINVLGLTYEEFRRCFLYENSASVRRKWQDLGGIAVEFLTEGYPDFKKLPFYKREYYNIFNRIRMLPGWCKEPYDSETWIRFIDEQAWYDENMGNDTILVREATEEQHQRFLKVKEKVRR